MRTTKPAGYVLSFDNRDSYVKSACLMWCKFAWGSNEIMKGISSKDARILTRMPVTD